MFEDTEKGATNNERLLFAARTDNEDLIQDIFESGDFEINFQDGLGNTALHYAASNGSIGVLEYILSQEGCDVDLLNRMEKATPLHLALRAEDEDSRVYVIESLVEAGANTQIRDKNGDTFLDLLPHDAYEIRDIVQKAQASASVSLADIASDDDEGSEGSGSGSE